MNIFRKMAMMALVAATLVLTGCTPEEEEQFLNAIDEATPSSLAGTIWKCNTTETYNGVTSVIHSTIRFDTKTEGYYYLTTISNGDTLEGGFDITYNYIKPKGELTLIIDGTPSGTMNFIVSANYLHLEIRNGEATRTYTLVENTPDPDLNLICSEWELVENDSDGTETTVLSFLNKREIGIYFTDISNEDPSNNEYDYIGVSYTMNGKSGTYYEDGYAYHFTINGNTMTVNDDYGNAFTLTRRNATAPQSLANTSWTLTRYDYYYYEDRESYFPDQLVLTYSFTSARNGTAHAEYTVPELPGIADESDTENFTYTYNRPKGVITFSEDGESIDMDFIAFSDMLVILGADGDYVLCSKVTR